GACDYSSCNAGFGDCNGNRGDGCETSLTTSQHCGACGNQCGSTQSCFNSVCRSTSCLSPCETTHTADLKRCDETYNSCKNGGDPRARGCTADCGFSPSRCQTQADTNYNTCVGKC